MNDRKTIPLMKPKLPEHDKISSYLESIDKNRWYSNFGPLVMSLEERFAEFFGVTSGGVASLSNGTSGLVNTIRAFDLPRDSYCLVPSWTFVATAAAPIACGLKPYFADIDEEQWCLTPQIAKKTIEESDENISVVIAVSAFGAPTNTKEWDKFTEETGVPVIIDAAGGFDSFSIIPEARANKTPVMISLHATKLCGCGEGGLVLTNNTQLIRKIKEVSNFGFGGGRAIEIPGTNGKMSEYSAAIAHAALDNWPEKRKEWITLRHNYMEALRGVEKGIKKIWISDEWASATCNIQLEKTNADEVISKLSEAGIECRQWWGKGCHMQPAYSDCKKADLPITELMADSVIGIPFSIDLENEDIEYIAKTLGKILN